MCERRFCEKIFWCRERFRWRRLRSATASIQNNSGLPQGRFAILETSIRRDFPRYRLRSGLRLGLQGGSIEKDAPAGA